MQKRIKELSDLFTPNAKPWGYRGSMRLWNDMKTVSEVVNIDSFKSGKECESYLYKLFANMTGHELKEGKIIYLEKYNPGHGMSSGMIAMTWWVMVAIPLLVRRFNEKSSPSKDEADYFKDIRKECSEKVNKEPSPHKGSE